MKTRRRWSLLLFFAAGAVIGAVIGFGFSWIDYGRPSAGFMFNWVLGLALIFGVLAAAAAALRNWLNRNPLE